jgi:small subunit ribosomal protein S6
VREYELIYVIQPDATPEREKEIHSRLDDAIARSGGTVLLRDDWGKRRLAYEIRKFQKGRYVLLSFLGDGRAVVELERILKLDADILRFLPVKVQDEVKDMESRIAEARAEEAERARRREERERLEAERAARQAAAAPPEPDGEVDEEQAIAGESEPGKETDEETENEGLLSKDDE